LAARDKRHFKEWRNRIMGRNALALMLALCLPLLALSPAWAKDGQTHPWDAYRLAVSTYFGDQLISEAELAFPDHGDNAANMVVTLNQQDGTHKLGSLLIAIPPQAWKGTPWPDIKQALPPGAALPRLRLAVLHGVRFYYYFPRSNWVRFKLYLTEACESKERWVETVRIAN
jgi:hypothetical protein